jgi:heme exporter protein B
MNIALHQYFRLVRHEVRLEFKNYHALTSLLVYSLATIFIAYISYRQALDPITWNALFWIIMLFAATNAIARSFIQDSRGLQLFHYTFLNPAVVILAKTTYNIILLSLLGFINLCAFSLFFSLSIHDWGQFALGLLLGSFGLSTVLTLVSGIVSKAHNQAALVAILGFPLLFPLLITIIKFSGNAIQGVEWAINQPNFYLLIALNSIIVVLSFLLFPYLWRD